MEMTRHRVTVRLHHTDAAGVLFYGRLFELVQEAFEEALRAGGLPLADLLRDGGFGLPVVHVEGDYRSAVRVGDVLEVRLAFEAGDRSLQVNAEFVDAAGRQVATVRVVHAVVDQETGTAVALPDAVRALTR